MSAFILVLGLENPQHRHRTTKVKGLIDGPWRGEKEKRRKETKSGPPLVRSTKSPRKLEALAITASTSMNIARQWKAESGVM